MESIWEARKRVGRSAPLPREMEYVWANVRVPSAGVEGYRPNKIARQFHFHPARHLMLTGGSRGGKSFTLAMHILTWLPHADLIWLAAESYDTTRPEFEYLVEAALGLGWTKKKLVNMPDNKYLPCSFQTLWGTFVESRTLRDVSSLVGYSPDMVVICEPGMAPEWAWRRARERVTTTRGRVIMAGTFEEQKTSWMEDLWRAWVRWPNPHNGKSFCMPTWLNTASFPLGKQDPEIIALKATAVDMADFLRRVVGVPTATYDTVMGDTWRPHLHVRKLEFERLEPSGLPRPVYLAVDPGYSEGFYVVLAIQVTGGIVHVIDEVALRFATHADVVRACLQRPWWPNVRLAVGDPYSVGSHIYGSPSVQHEWARMAHIEMIVPQRLQVEDEIRLVKAFLKGDDEPLLYVNESCHRLIYEMGHWRRRRAADGSRPPARTNCDAIKALAAFLSWWASRQPEESRVEDYSLS